MSFGQLELDIQPPYVLDDLSEPLVLTADDVVAVSRKFQLFHQSCQSGETRPSADCVNSWAELAQHPTLFRILFKAVPQAFTTATIKSSETHEATVQRLLLQSLIPFDRQDTMIDFLRELNGDLASSAVGVWRQVPSSDAAPPVLDPAPSLFDVHHLALADRAFIRLSCLYLHNADCDSPCYEAFARFDAAYRKWRDRAFGKKSMAASDFFPTGIKSFEAASISRFHTWVYLLNGTPWDSCKADMLRFPRTVLWGQLSRAQRGKASFFKYHGGVRITRSLASLHTIQL